MADGQVVFEINGDNRRVKDALRDTTDAIEREGKKWDRAADQAGDNIADKFTKVFKTIAASAAAAKVGKMLLDFGKDAIQAESDLEEVQNVVDVTFGDGAAQIEKWAKAAGTQFGLTEVQAKRFTSTLGAMMKSAGLAGPEIVDMSTDLAGLAADMASFYNLDFDTAFQKIRSGISGETEPLKQLGINMSVANLEAYALSQGITKAFNDMSQGEQTLLRYQYLIQATADAQGDFARTSDSYANAVRTLETNIANLKANVGNVMLPIVNEVVSGINDMIGALTQEPPTTVLDDFAAIDLKTAEKLAEIESTAEQARVLAGVLDDIAGKAGSLQDGVASDWESLLTALEIGGDIDLSGAASGVKGLSSALNGADPNTDRAQAWEQLLSALSSDIEGLSKLTGMSADDTAAWLERLAEGANALDPNSAEGWDKLFEQLRTGLTGGDLMESAVSELLAMGTESDEARAKLRDLGYSTEDIDTMQKEWLTTCRNLVNTIPGLSDVINAQTGEINGGVDAIDEYVNAWVEGQEKMLMWQAYYKKAEMYNERRANEYLLEFDRMAAEQRLKRLRSQMNQYGGYDAVSSNIGINGNGDWFLNGGNYSKSQQKEILSLYNDIKLAEIDAAKAAEAYQREVDDNAQAAQDLKDARAGLVEQYGEEEEALEGVAESAEEAAGSVREFTEEEEKAAKAAVEAATKALTDVQKAYDKIYDGVRNGLDKAAGGFGEVVTPAEKARQKMSDLTKQIDELNAAGKDSSGLKKTFQEAEGSIPSIQNMTKGLESQLEYLNKYQEAYDKARERGVSESILASLSDGSVESYDYLNALATDGTDAQIEQINEMWQGIISKKEEMSTNMADTVAGADEEFQNLVSVAEAALAELDQYSTAEANAANTVQGVADGIAANIPSVQEQVNALNAVLSGIGNVSVGLGGLFGGGFSVDGSHATGLDYVPFDNYLAQLHEGESILTAEEARIWRSFKNGGASVANTIDYEAMGGLMRDNIKPGGNVYLDGRIVGQVISQQQGNSLRNLERSGWQR